MEEEIPIGHITNGVHIPSWLAYQMLQLYDRHFPADWQDRMGEPEVWQELHNVDPGELWETHHALKNLLLAFVRRRVSRQCRRRGESDETVEAARNMLDPNVLTIGFARRFATYKRADLLLTDLDRLAAMVNDPDRPVQLIYAGKAHPADEPGKRLIQRIANLRNDPRFAGKVAFVEDYDINVARHLVQGVDVWLNNPRRPWRPRAPAARRRSSTALGISPSSTAGGRRRTTARTVLRSPREPVTSATILPITATGNPSTKSWKRNSSRSTTTGTSTVCRGIGSNG